MLSYFSCGRIFMIPWMIVTRLLCYEFSRQEYWTRVSCPSLVALPNPNIEAKSLMSPALAGSS